MQLLETSSNHALVLPVPFMDLVVTPLFLLMLLVWQIHAKELRLAMLPSNATQTMTILPPHWPLPPAVTLLSLSTDTLNGKTSQRSLALIVLYNYKLVSQTVCKLMAHGNTEDHTPTKINHNSEPSVKKLQLLNQKVPLRTKTSNAWLLISPLLELELLTAGLTGLRVKAKKSESISEVPSLSKTLSYGWPTKESHAVTTPTEYSKRELKSARLTIALHATVVNLEDLTSVQAAQLFASQQWHGKQELSEKTICF